MSSSYRFVARTWWVPLLAGLATLVCSCNSLDPLPGVEAGEEVAVKGTAANPSVLSLAKDIDSLEKHFEKYGSVVPKHGDVWGQARLMMHRQEFERVMRADVYKFSPSIQAAISTTDQAFLADAFSLQASVAATGAAAKGAGDGGTALDASKLLADPDKAVARESIKSHVSLGNYVTPNGKLALEPTLIEDQKKRYLDHLHELRRINEGDDNTDAPGYALNLMRIPISVMAGEKTQTGYGAECTITATPHLSDDLLPQTFRNLAINDLIDVLGLPITKLIDAGTKEDLVTVWGAYENDLDAPNGKNAQMMRAPEDAQGTFGARLRAGYDKQEKNELGQPVTKSVAGPTFAQARLTVSLATKAAAGASSMRPGKRRPFAPDQLNEVLAFQNVLEVAIGLYSQAKPEHVACKSECYYLDVQNGLREALNTAYDYLAQDQNQQLWTFCTPKLVEAVRTRDTTLLRELSLAFWNATDLKRPGEEEDHTKPGSRGITRALAWAIIVEAALLDAQFQEDMKATRTAKGCSCPPEGGAPLFLPHPPVETCRLFNDYVRCRWPLHIFSLDPMTEDQNVGDSFSLRREMQLAMSLAFMNGKMNASNFMRYVRRIEQDIDTIDLNRTIVGFSHGDNTFGWRFYPRVQTPPIDGNLQAIFRDNLIGGRGPQYDLHRRRLENGIRECVALVIMPSFVPYVDLDVTGNWFSLANPKCKELDLKDAMRLSRSIKVIEQRFTQVCDQERYRPQDVGLLRAKLEQLAQRMPLQEQVVDVPYEATHGGFAMLSSGTTDLAPELVGWCGAPGINPNGDTALFLVGDNFSVHQSRVIVGGRMLDPNCIITCSGQLKDDCQCAKAPAANNPAPGNAGNAAQKPPAGQQAPTNKTPVPAGNETGDNSCAAPDADAPPPADDKAKPAADAAPMPPANAAPKPAAAPPADGAGQAAPPAGKAPADGGGNAPDYSAPSADTYLQVPHFQVELLSRQVMRVVIPKGVSCFNGAVDVHIATPYGVSPHLSIPVLCATCAKPKPEGYSIRAANTTLTVAYTKKADNSFAPDAKTPVSGQVILDRNVAVAGATNKVSLTLLLKGTGGTLTKFVQLKMDANVSADGVIQFPPTDAAGAAKFAADLLTAIQEASGDKAKLPDKLDSVDILVADPTTPNESPTVSGTIHIIVQTTTPKMP